LDLLHQLLEHRKVPQHSVLHPPSVVPVDLGLQQPPPLAQPAHRLLGLPLQAHLVVRTSLTLLSCH
jgi:hypothetical protein